MHGTLYRSWHLVPFWHLVPQILIKVHGTFGPGLANFSLYWGLAIMMYESTLVSDESPYDAWANGDTESLSEKAKAGLSIFMNEGRCINCHSGPEFTGATVSAIRGVRGQDGPLSLMPMALGRPLFLRRRLY